MFMLCLQAITRHARHDNVKKKMEKQLKELEEKEKQRQQSETSVQQNHPEGLDPFSDLVIQSD